MKKQMGTSTFKSYYIICIICGMFVGLLMSANQIALLAWVGFSPAVFCLFRMQQYAKKLFLACFLLCASFLAICYVSMFTLDISANVGDLSVPVIVAGYVFIVAIHGLAFAIPMFIAFKIKCPVWLRALFVAFMWALAEYIIGIGAFGFSYVRLSATQAYLPEMLGILSALGSVGLSFLMMAVNVYMAQAIGYIQFKNVKPAVLCCTVVILIPLGNAVYGHFKPSPQEGESVSVAAIQYDLPSYSSEKYNRAAVSVELAEAVFLEQDADIVFFPESTVLGSFTYNTIEQLPYQHLAQTEEAYLFLGSYDQQEVYLENSVFMIDDEGVVATPYNKQQLVPIFENGFTKEFSFEIGDSRGVFTTEYGNVGTLICFESMFETVVRETVKEGADVIAILTNDSWFVGDYAKERHFTHAILRAAETQKYVVQSANGGVTGIVSPTGEVVARVEEGEEAYAIADISFLEGNTFFVDYGYFWLAFLGGVIAVIFIIKRKNNER